MSKRNRAEREGAGRDRDDEEVGFYSFKSEHAEAFYRAAKLACDHLAPKENSVMDVRWITVDSTPTNAPAQPGTIPGGTTGQFKVNLRNPITNVRKITLCSVDMNETVTSSGCNYMMLDIGVGQKENFFSHNNVGTTFRVRPNESLNYFSHTHTLCEQYTVFTSPFHLYTMDVTLYSPAIPPVVFNPSSNWAFTLRIDTFSEQ